MSTDGVNVGIIGGGSTTVGLIGQGGITAPILTAGGITTPVYGVGSGSSGQQLVGAVLGGESVAIFGEANKFGFMKMFSETPTGERVRVAEVSGWQFSAGMGPFFSTVLPDGTIAMPELQLAVSQVPSTGTTMACAFFNPATGEFYTVTVPTTTGVTQTIAVSALGVADTAGGADLSDSCVIDIAGTPVLFCVSAYPYRGWRVSTNGLYPVLAAFTKDWATGRWAYNASLSITAPVLRASDPTNGANVWPNAVNFYGETVTQTLLPCEVVALPRSGHLALAVYAPRSGHNWGSVAIIDAAAKVQRAWYEWADMTTPAGWGSRAFTRDITVDPSAATNAERICVNFDVFMQPNETLNAVVNATGGTWRIVWGGVSTAAIAKGASAATVQTALEAIAAIGAGNVTVKVFRPFLVDDYSVYEIELIGARAHLSFAATTITMNVASLTGNTASHITRWRTGGTGYDMQSPFPVVELGYNASTFALTPLTVPMYPAEGEDHLTRPEAVDSTFGMGWYTETGDYVASIQGVSANPENFTAFTYKGMHVYRKTGARAQYLTDWAPTTGWPARLGEARPTPDVVTNPVHGNANALALAIGDDPLTGAVWAASASGQLKLALPAPGWAPRSGNLTGPATFTDLSDTTAWTATAPDTLTFDSSALAAVYTAGATQAEGRITTATGTAGIPVPLWMVGQVVVCRVEARAATTARRIRPGVRFYDAAGAEVNSLLGLATGALYDRTTGYRAVIAAGVVPATAAYLAGEAVVLDVVSAEVHRYRRLELYVAGFTVVPDVDLNAAQLYVGATGGSWLAKGYVDPVTGALELPYLQTMTEAQAKNTRYPAWLVRVDLARVLAPYVEDA